MRERVAAARAGRSRARRRRVNVAHGQLGRLEFGGLPRQAAPLRGGTAAGAAREARFASVLSRSGREGMSRPARRACTPVRRVLAPRRQHAADVARPGSRHTHRGRGASAGSVLQALARPRPTAWPRRGAAARAKRRLRAPTLDVRHAAPGPRSAALRAQRRFYCFTATPEAESGERQRRMRAAAQQRAACSAAEPPTRSRATEGLRRRLDGGR